MQKQITLIFSAFFTVLTIGLLPLAANASTDMAIDATCRITTPDGSIGSGCVFEISQGQVYVLTAAHVAKAPTVACEFWSRGHQSSQFPAQLIARNEQIDAAILAVPEAAFGGILPRAIPVAPADCVLRPGDTIVSAGCANGSWESAWQGHVLGYQGNDLIFTPGPADGRSGSAILNADGSQIVALIRARNALDGSGIATSVQTLRAGLAHNTQCGPQGCPVPSTAYYSSPDTAYRLQIGGRINAAPPPVYSVPQTPWPTLPQPMPSQPPVDLSQLTTQLGRIADGMSDLRQPAYVPPYPYPPMQSTPDSANEKITKTLNQHGRAIKEQGRAIQSIADNIPRQIDAAVRPLAEQVGVVSQTIQSHGTLPERFAVAKDRVAQREPGTSKVRQDVDAVKEMLHTHHDVFGTLAVVGGLLFAAVLLGLITHAIHAHKQAVKDGQPDPIEQKLASLQAKLESQGKGGLADVAGDLLTQWKAVEAKLDAQATAQTAAQTIANVQQAASQAVTAALAANTSIDNSQ